MLILSFDTATKALSVALSERGVLVDKIESFSEKTHSERLMPAIDQLLTQNNVKLDDLSLIAAGHGPGSYTGIRIALSTALGLVHGTKTPLITVSTLHAMTNDDAPLQLALLDARGGRLFAAGYKGDETIILDHQTTAEKLAALLKDEYRDVPLILLGNGAPILKPYLASDQVENMVLIEGRYTDAYRLALLAKKEYLHRGRGLTQEEVRPFYAAPTQAERLANDR